MTDWYPDRDDSAQRQRYLGTAARPAPRPASFRGSPRAVEGRAGASGRRAARGFSRGFDAMMRAAGRVDDAQVRRGEEYDRSLIRRVSMLGVDPRSAEGQQILMWLDSGLDVNSPEVGDLVAQYQDGLIGPQSKKTRAGDLTAGPFNNQYGYRAGDEFGELDNLSTEYLARVQDRMAALGMLDGYVRGRKDQSTVKAFADLLWMSNAEGTSWIVQLADLEKQKEAMGDDWAGGDGSGSGDRAPFVAPTYLAPDYATLAQTVKSQLRDQLGRDPDDSEIALLTAELAGYDRERYDAEQAAAEADYNAAVAADDGATGQGGAVIQGVDPLARFKESFEQRFKAERQGIQDQAEAEQAGEIVRAAGSTLSRLTGGMG